MACSDRAIVVGGGLAGMAAANAILENGGKVLLLDKSAFCGGNSSKAASGINAAGTEAQRAAGAPDAAEGFAADTLRGGADKPELVKVLCGNSGADIEWLREAFGIELPLISRLGGHSVARTHRGKGKPPGMAITFALMNMVEKVAEKTDRAKIVTKACATRLLTHESGAVVGVAYQKDGNELQEYGPVVLATGGFGADFAPQSLLASHRPDLLHLPTTNGEHCTGDGVRLGLAAGARAVAMENVQVHPTGFVKEADPEAKVKFLASEVLRSVGGLLLNGKGERFCNELGRHDYITAEMWKHSPPFRLILNKAAADEVSMECKFYAGRGLMKLCESGEELAAHLGVPLARLEELHEAHFQAAEKSKTHAETGPWPAFPSGKSWDEASGRTGAGKRFFANAICGSAVKSEPFYVATVTPVIHYCVGGIEIDVQAAALGPNGTPVPGLFAAGEVAGGVHGRNRLAGNSLLDCLVFGRVAGKSCAEYMLGGRTVRTPLKELSEGVVPAGAEVARPPVPSAAAPAEAPKPPQAAAAASSAAPAAAAAAPAASPSASRGSQMGVFSREEVAKHKSRGDCWVIVRNDVLDCSAFLSQHPGGELAILTFAGRDATAEFDMIHPAGVIGKYAPDAVIGLLKGLADEEKGMASSSTSAPPPPQTGAVNKVSAATASEPGRGLKWHLEHMNRTTWFLIVIAVLFTLLVFLTPH